jgi:hypothetical protein
MYGHLSWFPSGRTDGETIFCFFFPEETYVPQIVLVSGKMAAHLVAATPLYLSVSFVNII